MLVGPDNGLLPPAVDMLGGAVEAVDISDSAVPPRAPVGHLPRPRPLRSGRRPPRPRATPCPTPAWPIDPATLERQPVSRPRLEQFRAFAHAERIDGFGNISLDLSRADLDGHPLAGSGRVSVGSRKRRRTATRAAAFEQVPDGGFLFYEDSSGRMAIAVNRGDASEVLDVRVGDVVELEPAP